MILNNVNIRGTICDIKIDGGKITAIGKLDGDGRDMAGATVIPGLIDCHTHGCVGADTMEGATSGTFEKLGAYLAKNGTTSWLPTTMTVPMEDIEGVLKSDTAVHGAQILGFHMEGPYICKKYKGAQNEKYIKAPVLDEYNSLPNIKLLTIAPELEGSMEFIKSVSATGCVVSLGHTNCDYDTAMKAIENGANCVTHTFNAMPPFHHREPSLIGAAIESNIYVQVICDGIHLHKAVVKTLYKLFGTQKMVLISDSMCATGLSDGEYEFGGQPIEVKDSVARTLEGAIAGSTSTLWTCVKKAVEFGIDFESAVKMATQTPAEMLHLNKGRVEVGYDADLLILDENLEIKEVIIAGATV